MPTTWQELTLTDLGTVSRGRSRHRPRNDPSLYGGPYPFVQTADVKDAELYLTRYSQTYNEAGLAQSKLWRAGTLLITIAANIAETAILGISACFPDSVVGFTADPGRSDTRFVKYCIDLVKLKMQNISRGTTQDNLSLDKLLGVRLRVPPITTQRKIASILSAYDDLIENNTRRIAILEEMARSLYREWFVHFRFPGHEDVQMVDSEMSRVPEGWRTRSLGEFLSVDKGVSYNGAGLTETGVPMVNLKCVAAGGGFVRAGTKPYSGAYKPRHTLRPGDIVVANTDLTQAGNVVGSPAIVPASVRDAEVIFSHHIYALRLGGEGRIAKHFLYRLLQSPEFKGFARGRASGTTVLGLPRDGITDFRFQYPPLDLQERFEDIASAMHELQEGLEDRNENLRRTRDLLLPKLVSGEIDVSDLGIDVGDAAG